jgi:hypothetical protein
MDLAAVVRINTKWSNDMATIPKPSEVLKKAKADLHDALNEYKVLQRPGHAAHSEFNLWLRGTANFIPMLEALERSWNAANSDKAK